MKLDLNTSASEKIYILGAGAIGMALAVNLLRNGRSVAAVRTSNSNYAWETIQVSVECDQSLTIEAPLEMVSLSKLDRLGAGTIVITAKATANRFLASELRDKKSSGPIVIMQNGIGVESPFINAGFPDIYRCVLYATSQEQQQNFFRFRSVAASPIGTLIGDTQKLSHLVTQLSTPKFQFRVEERIKEEMWKKAIMNAVFNSVCPLLEVDNGIFCRDKMVAEIALGIIEETVEVTKRIGLNLETKGLMEQLLMISKRSDGQLISTLQDLKNGNETEIDFLNLEIARIAGEMTPKIAVGRTKILGELIAIKSRLKRSRDAGEK
ncbi:MAG: 2-dehydropantoate 2-reductase [Verrucomicrobiota bacterium]|nr:2-dehydropantoate 2-reductase [Verrucomicrobiota bacterium]